jgi:hypothetical protein
VPALRYPLIIDQGADYTLSIPVLDDDNSPQTITGWGVAGQIRARHDSTAVLHELDLDPNNAMVILHIPGSASETWTFLSARYDVELTSPSGSVTRLIEGPVVVRPNVTR